MRLSHGHGWLHRGDAAGAARREAVCDEEKKLGKVNLTRRDEEIWANWPKASRAASPGCGATWTTRTCWRSGTRSRCDYIIAPGSATSAAYHSVVTPPEVAADHDMATLRINIAEKIAPRSRRSGASAPWTREMWRSAPEKTRLVNGTRTEKMQVWDEVFNGKMQIDEDSRMRSRAATLRTQLTKKRTGMRQRIRT